MSASGSAPSASATSSTRPIHSIAAWPRSEPMRRSYAGAAHRWQTGVTTERRSTPATAARFGRHCGVALALGGGHLPDDEGSIGHLALDVVQLLLPLLLFLWRALSPRGTSHDNKPTPPGGGNWGEAACKRRTLG